MKVLVCRELETAGFANGFSTRLGGVSSLNEAAGGELNLAGFTEDSRENIFENRRRFLAVFDRPYKLALAWQVHGDDIRVVRQFDEAGDSDERADAVASDLDGVLAGVKTADCVPLLLGDAKTGAFAAVHAGWRGTALSIAAKTVARLKAEFGTDPQDIVAAIGPAASGACYEVGREVIEAFETNFPDLAARYFRPTRDGHALVNLHAANRDQLTASGVAQERIFAAPFCTLSHTDLFFSYRIEKSKYGKTGRLLSVIGKI